jgi:hypothetical protein
MKIISKILVFLLLGCLIKISFDYVKLFRENKVNPDAISLYITLVGTFLGVLVAIIVTHWYDSLKKRMLLSQYYFAAINEIGDIAQDIYQEYQFAAAGMEAVVECKKRVPMIMETIVSDASFHEFFSEEMKKNIFGLLHPSSFAKSIEMLEKIPHYRARLNNELKDPWARRSDVETRDYKNGLISYYCELDFTRRVLHVERQYLWTLMTNRKLKQTWEKLKIERNNKVKEMENSKYKLQKVEGEIGEKDKEE